MSLPAEDLTSLAENVRDSHSFLLFADALCRDRVGAERSPVNIDGFQGGWANNDLVTFLDAAIAWANDAEFGARLAAPISNPWQQFAYFLLAGREYE